MNGNYIKTKLDDAQKILAENNIIKKNFNLNSLKNSTGFKWRIIMAAELLNFASKNNLLTTKHLHTPIISQ